MYGSQHTKQGSVNSQFHDACEAGSHDAGNGQAINESAEPIGSDARSLPSRDVTDANFDDAYVRFIMYCNPAVSANTDTAELRKTFRSPPKSDGKTFNTYNLFVLIRKLELRELKTWAQLAIELGVEPPVLEKGQSAQKIQQYAVRLKRWMHAMHVDAFFEYLLDKTHIYWTSVPNAHDPAPEHGRDGVVSEEDLALRALLPETKPKRGRRKADDRDDNSELTRSPAQRPRLYSPAASEDFNLSKCSSNATPATAQPGSHMAFAPTSTSASAFENFNSAPQQRATQSFGSHVDRWHPHEADSSFSAYPQSAHPQSAYPGASMYPHSAILPRSNNSFLFDDEPQSAITPSKGRSKRRHGPAVSSAWPSNSTTNSGKLRGRPPSNRNVLDGPFSTFPANPATNAPPVINLRDPTPTQTPVVEKSNAGEAVFAFPNPAEPLRSRATRTSLPFLQVPERVGAPVRLATPPPVVPAPPAKPAQEFRPNYVSVSSSGKDFAQTYEAYEHADLTRHQVNSGDTGTNASAAPSNSSDPTIEDRTNVEAIELACVQLMLSAAWYDIDGQPSARCSIKEAMLITKQIIVEMCNEAPAQEIFLMSLCSLVGATALLIPHINPITGKRETGSCLRVRRFGQNVRTTRFGIKWSMKFGCIESNFVKTIEISEKALGPEGIRHVGDEFDLDEADQVPGADKRNSEMNDKLASGKEDHSVSLTAVEKKLAEMTSLLAEKDRQLRAVKGDVIMALLKNDRK